MTNLIASPTQIHAEDGGDYERSLKESLRDNGRAIFGAINVAKKITEKTGVELHWRDVLNRDMPKGTKMTDDLNADPDADGSKPAEPLPADPQRHDDDLMPDMPRKPRLTAVAQRRASSARSSAPPAPAEDLSYIAPALRSLAIRVDSLIRDPANARRHGNRSLDAIRTSLAKFGQQAPIVFDADRVVRKGNGTHEAAAALGWTWIAAVPTDLSGPALTAFAIADNRTSDLSEWDPDELQRQIEAIDLSALDGLSLEGLGFQEGELDALAKGQVKKAHGFAPAPPKKDRPCTLADQFKLIVDCKDEQHQTELLERFAGEGSSAGP